MTAQNERWQILEMIEQGVITASEGVRLLEALREGSQFEPVFDEEAAETSVQPPAHHASAAETSETQEPTRVEAIRANLAHWRRWWLIPFWVGVGITLLGAGLMTWAIQTSGLGWWFAFTWLPFALGLAVMVLAWNSRTARWLHLRIRQKPGERPASLAISFPLPIRPTAWFLRTFGRHIPPLQNTGLDEILLALEQSTSPQQPFYMEADEGEDGERVEVYIG
jgi:hypothetical protein